PASVCFKSSNISIDDVSLILIDWIIFALGFDQCEYCKTSVKSSGHTFLPKSSTRTRKMTCSLTIPGEHSSTHHKTSMCGVVDCGAMLLNENSMFVGLSLSCWL